MIYMIFYCCKRCESMFLCGQEPHTSNLVCGGCGGELVAISEDEANRKTKELISDKY